MCERIDVRGKTTDEHLHFQVRSQPRLAGIFGRSGRPEAAQAIPPVARGRRGQAEFSATQQSQPRRDREVDRQRGFSALEVEGREVALSALALRV